MVMITTEKGVLHTSNGIIKFNWNSFFWSSKTENLHKLESKKIKLKYRNDFSRISVCPKIRFCFLIF